jgi:hypothetical protein
LRLDDKQKIDINLIALTGVPAVTLQETGAK